MASTNKTGELKLNSWIGTDHPKRIDFVEDNQKIDNFATEIKGEVKRAETQLDNDKANKIDVYNKEEIHGLLVGHEPGNPGFEIYSKEQVDEKIEPLEGHLTEIDDLPDGMFKKENGILVKAIEGVDYAPPEIKLNWQPKLTIDGDEIPEINYLLSSGKSIVNESFVTISFEMSVSNIIVPKAGDVNIIGLPIIPTGVRASGTLNYISGLTSLDGSSVAPCVAPESKHIYFRVFKNGNAINILKNINLSGVFVAYGTIFYYTGG